MSFFCYFSERQNKAAGSFCAFPDDEAIKPKMITLWKLKKLCKLPTSVWSEKLICSAADCANGREEPNRQTDCRRSSIPGIDLKKLFRNKKRFRQKFFSTYARHCIRKQAKAFLPSPKKKVLNENLICRGTRKLYRRRKSGRIEQNKKINIILYLLAYNPNPNRTRSLGTQNLRKFILSYVKYLNIMQIPACEKYGLPCFCCVLVPIKPFSHPTCTHVLL